MQIVIDIPEIIYKRGLPSAEVRNSVDVVSKAILNGTPLPKGHGDLIDRDELINAPYRKGGFVNWVDEIEIAEAVLEAYKDNKRQV